MRALLIIALLFPSLALAQSELKAGQEDVTSLAFSVDDFRSDKIIIQGKDGREAIIDFSGDKVTYSGELPIDESAKLFFEYVFGTYIVEPAPRPEFNLTTCGSSQACVEANLVRMTDELRHLRKEIEALKR